MTERKEQDIAFGIWQVPVGKEGTRNEVRDVAEFRKELGDEFIKGFAQLFNATNRIDGLLSLMTLNNRKLEADGHPRSAHDPDSTRAARNRNLIVMMMWGVFHELNDAIETLQKAGLTKALQVRGKDKVVMASWKRLRTIAKNWRNELEKTVRNQLAYHLGDAETLQKGLEAWPKDEPLILFTNDSPTRADVHFYFGFDLLCRGLGIQTEDVEKLATNASKHDDLSDDAIRVFWGLIYAKGAPIMPVSVIEADGMRDEEDD